MTITVDRMKGRAAAACSKKYHELKRTSYRRTQQDLAQEAGISRSNVSALVNGRIENISLEKILRLCGALAVETDFVVRASNGGAE